MSTQKAVFHIGSDAIAMTVQDDQYTNHFIFHAALPYSGYQNGEFLKLQELHQVMTELIRHCREDGMCDPEEFLVGVPAEFTTVVLKNVETSFGSLHKITDADLDDLMHEGNTYDDHPTYVAVNASAVHYVLDGGIVSITPTGETARSLMCYTSYVLAERKFIDLFNHIAEAEGVKFEYTSELSAELMYVVPPEVRDRGVVLIDSGYISTGVAYAKGDGLLHSLGFSVGTGHIAGDLTFVYEVPFTDAHKITGQLNLNMNYGPEDEYVVEDNGRRYPVSQINPVAICRVEDMARMIAEAIARSRIPVPADAEVMLTGSGIANIVGAKDVLARVLKRNVRLLRPNCLNLNKPKDSAMVGLLRVQQESMPFRTWKGKFYKLLQKIRRKNENA